MCFVVYCDCHLQGSGRCACLVCCPRSYRRCNSKSPYSSHDMRMMSTQGPFSAQSCTPCRTSQGTLISTISCLPSSAPEEWGGSHHDLSGISVDLVVLLNIMAVPAHKEPLAAFCQNLVRALVVLATKYFLCVVLATAKGWFKIS